MDASVAVRIGAEVVQVPGWLALIALVALAALCFGVAGSVWFWLGDRNERDSRWRELDRRVDGLQVNPWGRGG
ncbi:MAG: hypothetical protein V3S29_13180 [bacterium]